MSHRRNLVAFGLSGFAQNVVGTCIGVHLFVFYTDVVGLSPLWVSLGLSIAMLWDAVAGVLVGRMSDATRSPRGRRRPYILAGALPLGLAFALLLSPPEGLSGDALGIYFTVVLLVLFTATTLTQVPALSLLPELTSGYHERTRFAAAREMLGNVGDLVGLLLPIALLLLVAGPAGASDPGAARSAFGTASLIGGALAAAALLGTVAGTRERRAPHGRGAPSCVPLGAALRALRHDRALRTILAATLLGALSFAFAQTMVLYVLEHVMEESDPAVHLAAFVLNAVAAILSYPFWTWLSRRFGKPAAFRAGLVLSSVAFGAVFFARPGAHALLFSVMAFSGAANVGFWMTLQSLAADVTDLDELAHGERREGLFAGLVSLARKAAFALAAVGVGIGLTLAGHHAGQAPDVDTVFGMKLLFAVPPTLLVLAALLVFRRFPMTRAVHAEVLEALALRAAARQGT